MTTAKDRSIDTDFPITLEIDVAWGDMDAFAHVNNTVFFRWFESARMAFLAHVGFAKAEDNSGVGPILATTECVFKRPVAFPDTVRVGTRIARLDADRFTMEYQIYSTAQGQVAAWGSGVVVAFDYDRNMKSSLPAAVRSRIEDLMNKQTH